MSENWCIYKTKKYGILMIFAEEDLSNIDESSDTWPPHIADDVRGESNARLIAAAPKMLAVLQHDVIEIANLAAMVDPVQTQEYMESVYDAIAKARRQSDE